MPDLALGVSSDAMQQLGGPERLEHLRAQDYVTAGFMSAQEWESAYTFAVVRNPYDRLASAHRFRCGANPSAPKFIPFREWVLERLPVPGDGDSYDHVRSQYEYLHDDEGRLIVDSVGYYEQLARDFAMFCRRTGLPEVVLGHARPSARPPRRIWVRAFDRVRNRLVPAQHREPYCRETRAFVRERYAKDFAAFGYDP